jgi:hypothetical protein
MITTRLVAALSIAAALCLCRPASISAQTDGVGQLLRQLELAVQHGAANEYAALLSPSADRDRAAAFAAAEFRANATRVVLQERDRARLLDSPNADAFRLVIEVFIEMGNRGRAATWQLDVHRELGGGTPVWRVDDQTPLAFVDNLYRLSLNSSRQFVARHLTIRSDDVELSMADGTVFVADADVGVTAAVLLGRGELSFHPTPETEQGQLKIFAGSETLQTPFDAAFVRLNPTDFDQLVAAGQVVPSPVAPALLRRAEEVFREESAKSFAIDLGDLSHDAWSVLPSPNDFLAEVRTRRYDTLTYARSSSEPEDINFFDRKRHRNIALYPSARKLAARGPSFDDIDASDIEVLDYDVDVSVQPDRRWVEGRAVLTLRVRANSISSITLRLASPLAVQSVVSDEFGRLFGIRIKNQSTLVLGLPATVVRGTVFSVTVTYAGALDPERPDRETAGGQSAGSRQDDLKIPDAPFLLEPSLLYSTGTFWYPQPTVGGYSTAAIRITVPQGYACVATGSLLNGSPTTQIERDSTAARKTYIFSAAQPVRYLAFIVSRFAQAQSLTLDLPPPATAAPDDSELGAVYSHLDLNVVANPRQLSGARELASRAADIVRFYQSLLGDAPYPTFTIAAVESELPGGHSPPYFAVLNQPPLAAQYEWRNDPTAFASFPDFFLAHELAHQWWGQAVGWRNYHDQWLSEGFAQYFSVLYARHRRGEDAFTGVMRQMRRWAMAESSQGPVSLGYRVGHIRGDGRIFRAVVYNKSAAVLHMLRRLVGDDAFFAGLRRFYYASRFRRVSTDELRAALETESGRSLDRFFAGWIRSSALPRVKFGYQIDGSDVVLHAEQTGTHLFDIPLTVTLQFATRKVDVPLVLTDRAADVRVPLTGALRSADVRTDDGTLAEIVKN